MPDITKGYTFSDSKADWASDKETALRLNRMVDDAKVNLVAGTNITISRGSSGVTINSTASGSGTVTGVTVVSANGLAGTASAAPVPAITLSTTVSGIVKGNGTALSAATAGTDYQAPITLTTTGTSGAATFTSNTLNIPNYTGGGGGDVFGPSSSVNNNVAFFDGTTGKLIKDSGLSLSGTNTGDQTISLTGDVTGSGAGSFVTSIAAGVIVDADINASAAIVDSKLATISTASKVSNSATTATSANTASAIVARDASGNFSAGTITASLTGNVSGSSGSTTGNAATVTTNANLTGDVTSVGNATTIASSVVSNAKLANVATSTFKGRTTAGTGSPEDLTSTQATALLNSFSSTLKGLAPASGGGTSNFLRADGNWTTPSGGGDVSGPTSSVNDKVVFFDGTTGKLIKDSGLSLSGTNTGDQTNISGNAATVTTNANLTGPITSVGNATSVALQTGTGSTFVMQASPTLTTPALGTPTSGLLNSCTSNPNATGNVPRTFQNRAGDVFNVKDFGAVGNGSTDDTTSITSAIDAALSSSNGGAVYFPAGQYKVTSKISRLSVSKSLYLYGDQEVSEIQAHTSSGVFEFKTTSDLSIVIGFGNLEINAVSTGGIAISAEFLPAENTHKFSRFYAEGLSFGAINDVLNRFSRCIKLNGASNAFIDNCIFNGNCPSFQKSSSGTYTSGSGAPIVPVTPINGSVYLDTSNNYAYYLTASTWFLVANVSGYASPSGVVSSGMPFRTLGTAAIEFSGTMSVNSAISNCGMNFAEYGFYCPIYQEGVNLNNVAMVDVKYGCYFASNINLRSTYFTLVGCHVDARGGDGGTSGVGGAAVALDNVSAFFISSSLLLSDRGQAVLWMKGVHESSIVGNQLYGPTKGIIIESGSFSSNSWSHAITSNNFRNAGSTNVEVGSGVTQVIANSNTASDGTTSTNLIISDSGTNNQIWRTTMVGVNSSLYLDASSPQTYLNNTEAAVTWSGERYSGGFGIWNAGTPTRINVPSGARRVRVSAGTSWDASSDGQFVARIRSNSGTNWAKDNRYGTTSNGSGSATLITPIIDVGSTTYFELYLIQVTGSSLDLFGANATYLTLEVL